MNEKDISHSSHTSHNSHQELLESFLPPAHQCDEASSVLSLHDVFMMVMVMLVMVLGALLRRHVLHNHRLLRGGIRSCAPAYHR